jgi:hypothetical protein
MLQNFIYGILVSYNAWSAESLNNKAQIMLQYSLEAIQ